jgi:hypothetical protein
LLLRHCCISPLCFICGFLLLLLVLQILVSNFPWSFVVSVLLFFWGVLVLSLADFWSHSSSTRAQFWASAWQPHQRWRLPQSFACLYACSIVCLYVKTLLGFCLLWYAFWGFQDVADVIAM